MIRKIIRIDEEKCNGCGICANACHEGAIDIVDGKAKLVRENFCDGFGDCLPACPMGAITFEEREAPAYDEAAVKASQAANTSEKRSCETANASEKRSCETANACEKRMSETVNVYKKKMSEIEYMSTHPSRLMQWPCQIKLLPAKADFFDGAKLLIAADCTAYAYANMHEEFMKGSVTLIGCPKLDGCDYTDKLTQIITNNDIRSVTIVRMEVPCCGGLQWAAENAIKNSGKFLPWRVVTISRNGEVIE